MTEIATAKDLQERFDDFSEDPSEVLDVDVLAVGAALTAALDRNTAALETINETLDLIRADRLKEGT